MSLCLPVLCLSVLCLSVCLVAVCLSVCLSVIQLVGMMRGIASGMRYLSEMGYVHRVSLCLSVGLSVLWLSLCLYVFVFACLVSVCLVSVCLPCGCLSVCLSVIQLVGMMRGIASGMRYLSEMGYVHRVSLCLSVGLSVLWLSLCLYVFVFACLVSVCLVSVCLSVCLSVIQLVGMMRGIASGMRYLSEMEYVHKVSLCLSVWLSV